MHIHVLGGSRTCCTQNVYVRCTQAVYTHRVYSQRLCTTYAQNVPGVENAPAGAGVSKGLLLVEAGVRFATGGVEVGQDVFNGQPWALERQLGHD